MGWRVGWISRAVLGCVCSAWAVGAQAGGLWFAAADLPEGLFEEVLDQALDPAPEVVLLGVVPLPEHPTDAEVADHLWRIAEATELLPHAPRRSDPQMALLEALACDHLDELVQAHERYAVLRYYLDTIIHREIALRGGPDAERLSVIVLRQDADDARAWSFVLDISRATLGQRRVSANDPQVEMLKSLAAEHMGVLVDAVELTELRFYAMLAIREMADESHKETLIAALPQQPRLISVVRSHGWSADAVDELMVGLATGVDYMPRTWVQVVVELEDPATYDALALHLLRVRCAPTYYHMMRDLPGINLRSAVCAGWERVWAEPKNARELREVSQIAVGHGHAGALAQLVALLPDDNVPTSQYEAAIREVVLQHIEFAGTNAQIKAWHAANRERLYFSTPDRVFYAAGQLK